MRTFVVSLSEAYEYLFQELTAETGCVVSHQDYRTVAEIFSEFLSILFNAHLGYEELKARLYSLLEHTDHQRLQVSDLCDVLNTLIFNRLTTEIPGLKHVSYIRYFKMINRTDVVLTVSFLGDAHEKHPDQL